MSRQQQNGSSLARGRRVIPRVQSKELFEKVNFFGQSGDRVGDVDDGLSPQSTGSRSAKVVDLEKA